MAQKVLILGNSGTGKSASLRNFDEKEIEVISCAGKPLPFKNHFTTHTPTYEHLTADVLNAMGRCFKPVLVIDDAQYIMSFQYMRRIHENGWEKWNDIQSDFFAVIQACDLLQENTIVYFLSHLQKDEDGLETIKTMGKMLDSKITIEGLFTTVLKTNVSDGKYYFLTQNNGKDTVKSPIGMFETYAIDNDLKYVDTKIRNYYEIGEHATDEEVKAMDEEHAAPEVEKPDVEGRKRRRRKVKDEAKDEPEEKQSEASAEEAGEEKPKRRRRKKREPETVEDDSDLPFIMSEEG